MLPRWTGVACCFLLSLASASLGRADDTARDRAAEMAALVAAYPGFLTRAEGNDLVWLDGTRMPIDDGRAGKPFELLLDSPDIEDQFFSPYPLGNKGLAPGENVDPGRVRFEPLFKRMYGDCRKGSVEGHLVSVPWLPKHQGGKVKVTAVNGVDKALAAVSAELDALPEALIKFLKPSSGTYNCRVIAGTGRTSVHAYGAAIDINSAHASYWRWEKPDSAGHYPYRNVIPIEIVDVFERHGFIWGGKWYHYDTMHFEYRPELIALAKSRQGATPP